MRKYIFIFCLFSFVFCFTQNKQVLYNFAELPQTLLQNPGAEISSKYYFGIPLLSGVSAEAGLSGFTLSDLFLKDNVDINDKISRVLNKITDKDFASFYSQIEVLNAGFRYDNKTYFSFGFYEEIEAIAYFPNDIVTLLNEGNAAFLNKAFSLSEILYKIDALGVLHAGISRKINKKLTLGARIKLYSSALNIESTNNTGTFTTVNGVNNIFTHHLNNANVELKTSGIIEDDEFINDPSTYIKNTFFGSNLGIGFDLGFTYNLSSQIKITGSILDIGFIHHKKNIKNSFLKGDYTFEGINFQYNDSTPNYLEELNSDFKEKVEVGDNNDSYISWRPAKINVDLKYSFGERRSRHCYDNTFKEFYTDAFGVHLYSVFRPLSPQFALTGFYEKVFSKNFQTKVTYTIDQYSYHNIGAGIYTKIGSVNFYALADNILSYNNIASANNISFQLGINLIFN